MRGFPPACNQGGQQGAILMSLQGVAFALIPNHATEWKRQQRRDHALEQSRRGARRISDRGEAFDRESSQRALRERQADAPSLLPKIAEPYCYPLPVGRGL